MKIVYIFQSMAVVGGAEKILTEKMNYLSTLPRYEIILITYQQGKHPIAFPLASTVKHIDLGISFHTLYKYGLIKRSLLYPKLKKQFQKELSQQIELIQPDIICATTYSLFEVKAIANLDKKICKVLESHSAKEYIGKKSAHKGNLIMSFISTLVDRRFYKNIAKCDALITLTHEDAHSWKKIKKAIVIPNMLTFFPNERISSEKEHKQIIAAGRLTEQKGFDLLIQSWKNVAEKHPDWTLHIYGDGEDKNKLLNLIESYGLNNSLYIHPPTNNIYDKYFESDFYVMSSRWEGFGLVLAEAMSCGVPCISFACPHGPSDIINDNIDGLLVENGNINLMSEKIGYLIEHPEIRKQMGEAARENIQRYLPENVMPQWTELFKDLIKEKNK